MQLGQLRVSNKIKTLAQSGPSVRYQVIRLLVYTGELDDDQHYGSLFTDNDCGRLFSYRIVTNACAGGCTVTVYLAVLNNSYNFTITIVTEQLFR